MAKALKDRLVEWWDWKVYWLAYRSMCRMCQRKPGFAYLFKLSIDGWLEDHPVPENVKYATKVFYESQKQAV